MSKQTFYEFLDGRSDDSVYLISLDDIAVVSPCKDEGELRYTFTITFKQGGKVTFYRALGVYKALLEKIRSETEVVQLQTSGHDASAILG